MIFKLIVVMCFLFLLQDLLCYNFYKFCKQRRKHIDEECRNFLCKNAKSCQFNTVFKKDEKEIFEMDEEKNNTELERDKIQFYKYFPGIASYDKFYELDILEFRDIVLAAEIYYRQLLAIELMQRDESDPDLIEYHQHYICHLQCIYNNIKLSREKDD